MRLSVELKDGDRRAVVTSVPGKVEPAGDGAHLTMTIADLRALRQRLWRLQRQIERQAGGIAEH